MWCRDKKLSLPLAASVPVLTAGYMAFEYRLFREIFFGNQATIRESMEVGSISLRELPKVMGEVFTDTVFHAQDSHKYWILPVCVAVLLWVNLSYLKNRQWKRMLTDPGNLILGLIFFNCLVYGLYYLEPLRSLIECLVPPLTGFQFNRTIFFNPLLWYALLFLCLKKVWDLTEHEGERGTSEKEKLQGRMRRAASGIGVIAVLVVMLVPQVYNDFYSNCYHQLFFL